MIDNYVTGAEIKNLRENKKMTQEQLAQKINVTAKAVSKWETGNGFPDISLLEPLAAALGITALASTGTYAEGANTEVNLIVNPVLSITATESIDLSVTPTAAGTFVSDDIAVNVITNSATGYKLYLSSNSAETALTSAAAGASIPTVASAATSENMANNTWGYSLSEAFNPVPASSAPEMIKETSTASVSTADVTTVTVGAKVDTSIPSG